MASAAMTALAVTTGRVACAAEEDAASGSDSVQLEEITVTATKRAERLQDVPVSVTALTSAVLDRGNVRELGDLVKLSPGLVIQYGSQPGNFAISMRGIGTFSNGIAVESDVARHYQQPRAEPGRQIAEQCPEGKGQHRPPAKAGGFLSAGAGGPARDFFALGREARASLLHSLQLGSDQQIFDQAPQVSLHRRACRLRIAGSQTFHNGLVLVIQGRAPHFPGSLQHLHAQA